MDHQLEDPTTITWHADFASGTASVLGSTSISKTVGPREIEKLQLFSDREILP
jgi:hypothetical protein